jgi:hypothetical protein
MAFSAPKLKLELSHRFLLGFDTTKFSPFGDQPSPPRTIVWLTLGATPGRRRARRRNLGAGLAAVVTATERVPPRTGSVAILVARWVGRWQVDVAKMAKPRRRGRLWSLWSLCRRPHRHSRGRRSRRTAASPHSERVRHHGPAAQHRIGVLRRHVPDRLELALHALLKGWRGVDAGLSGRFHPQIRHQNKRGIGKSQSIRSDSKRETPGSRGGRIGSAGPNPQRKSARRRGSARGTRGPTLAPPRPRTATPTASPAGRCRGWRAPLDPRAAPSATPSPRHNYGCGWR